MRVLVTGANGYVGRHVVSALIEQGRDVVVAVRPGGQSPRGVEAVPIDVLDFEGDIFRETGSPDVCIHLAWEQGFAHNNLVHLDNVPKHYRFMRNMLAGGLRHLVNIGTAHEIGYHLGAIDENTPTNPAHPYGYAKDFLRRAQQALCEQTGAKSQWLRCFYITGDDRRNNSIFRKLLDAADKGEDTFPLNDGELLFDFIHVAELARQIAKVSSQTDVTGIINCCTGRPQSLRTRVLNFLEEQKLSITPQWGVFPLRPYGSRGFWGDRKRLDLALEAANQKMNGNL